MYNFPEKTVVGQKFQIVEVSDKPNFYGFPHKALVQKEKRSFRLLSLHDHFEKNDERESSYEFFLKIERGEQSGRQYVAFPDENLVSYYDHLSSLEENPRAFDYFFLQLIEALHTLHVKSNETSTLPYLNPDSVFVQNGTVKVLALPFLLTKMEASVRDMQRFFSPIYLNTQLVPNAIVSASHDYFPVIIMLLEAYQKKAQKASWENDNYHIPWDRNSYKIAIQSIQAEEYKGLFPFLDFKFYMKTEEEVYKKLKEFFVSRLQLMLSITTITKNIRKLSGEFELGRQKVPFPGKYKIPYDSKNWRLVFPNAILDNDAPEDIQYELVNCVASPGLVWKEKGILEFKDAAHFTKDPSVVLQYEQKVRLLFEAVPSEAASKVEVDGNPIVSSSTFVAANKTIPLRVHPKKGYEALRWEIDGQEITALAQKSSCSLEIASSPRKVKVHFQRVRSFAVLGTVLALAIFGLLATVIAGMMLSTEKAIPEPPETPLASSSQEETPPVLAKLSRNAQGFMEGKRLKDGMVMIEIPAGPYKRKAVQKNKITILEDKLQRYWIDKYEVSIEQYLLYLNDTKKNIASAKEKEYNIFYDGVMYKPGKLFKGKLPITNLSFEEAGEYARWAGADLPFEEEWIKAAGWNPEKAQPLDYPWGDTEGGGNYFDLRSSGHLQNVDLYSECVSAYGIFNLGGNAAEFCKLKEGQTITPILKGGSFKDAKEEWPVYSRSKIYSYTQKNDVGFRCVVRE